MKKYKLFCVLGMSGSGKSTIESAINKVGYARKVRSCTTRTPRSYEIDSEDYYFISDEIFNIYLRQGQYAEHSTYTTVDGVAQYGINKNDIKLNEGNYIAVINVNGYNQLFENLGHENVVGIYIKRNDKDRIISTLKRDDSDFENVFKEVYRRYDADKIDFAGMENKVNYVVENKDLDQAIQEVIKIIEEETK